jgi:hypothetical protein
LVGVAVLAVAGLAGAASLLLVPPQLRLRLAWATAEPWPEDGAAGGAAGAAAGAGTSTVELRLEVENTGRAATQSTTILWEPGFAGRYVLATSDPPAWRVRIDERGWGVYDTFGILPGRAATFRLVFTEKAPAEQGRVVPPRLVVVADGHLVIAESVADVRRLDVAFARPQDVFEQGPLAAAADRAAFIPSDARGAFPLAAGAGLLLGAVLAGGGLAAARAAAVR